MTNEIDVYARPARGGEAALVGGYSARVVMRHRPHRYLGIGRSTFPHRADEFPYDPCWLPCASLREPGGSSFVAATRACAWTTWTCIGMVNCHRRGHQVGWTMEAVVLPVRAGCPLPEALMWPRALSAWGLRHRVA